MPALVLSMSECLLFYAWLLAYLSTAESMFSSVKGMHMFACPLEPGTISVSKKEQLLLNSRQAPLPGNCFSGRQPMRFTEADARMHNIYLPAPALPFFGGAKREGVV